MIIACSKCGQKFPTVEECVAHELACEENTITCNKCGSKNAPHYHHIDLGMGDYATRLDGEIIEFDLCDDCLAKFVESFKIGLHSEEDKANEALAQAFAERG